MNPKPEGPATNEEPRPGAAPWVLPLEGNLNVFSLQHQWRKVEVLLSLDGGSVAVDLSAVGDLDESGVELLSTLAQALESRGVAFQVRGAKEAWRAEFTALGVAGLLDGGRA